MLTRLVREREAAAGPSRVPVLLAFMHGRSKLRLGELDSADHWLARVGKVRDGSLKNWFPTAEAQLRLDQGKLPEARAAIGQLPGGLPGRRATAAMLRARLLRAEGDPAGASRLLEGELGTLYRESTKTLSLFTLPLVTAGEWRLAAGDPRGADSFARLGRSAAALDSLALSRSALAGRAELLLARALHTEQDRPAARAAAERAIVALANGYGADHQWTRWARALRDSLSSER